MKSLGSDMPREQRILRRPTVWLRRYLSSQDQELTFDDGYLAVGLEIETQVRIFEQFESARFNERHTFEVASALQTLQQSLGLTDSVAEWYDKLIEFSDACRPTFVPDDEQPRTELSSAASALLRASDDGALARAVALAQGTSPRRRVYTDYGLRALPEYLTPPTEPAA